MEYRQIIKFGSLVVGSILFANSIIAEQPHVETPQIEDTFVTTFAFPASASGIAVDSWTATIEVNNVPITKREMCRRNVDYAIVTAHPPNSPALSLAVHNRTARDRIEALIAAELARIRLITGELVE
jgi:hypothetical protein